MKNKEKKIAVANSFLKHKGLDSKFDVDGFLGSGGNGCVCRVKNKESGVRLALKYMGVLRKDADKEKRFRSEIAALRKIKEKGLSGVIPIEEFSEKDLWYTMPVAQRIEDYLSNKKNYRGC